MIWVSPVFDEAAVQSSDLATQCRGKPVLVISGERDDRVPSDYVHGNVKLLKLTGATVSERFIGPADHFLIFSHRAAMTRELATWLSQVGSKAHILTTE